MEDYELESMLEQNIDSVNEILDSLNTYINSIHYIDKKATNTILNIDNSYKEYVKNKQNICIDKYSLAHKEFFRCT